MLYQNSRELLTLLQKEGLHAKHRLGQNFLIQPQIIDKIIAAAEIKNTDRVLEIGPGLGILTEKLLAQAQKVTAVEKDRELYGFLQKHFRQAKNLTLINADILQTEPPRAPYKLIANIPYYITSPIISHFLRGAAARRPDLLVLMTQLEVARKICAKAGNHSMLSLQTQLFAEPKLIHQVSRGNFFPAPKVDSAILLLRPRPTPLLKRSEVFLTLIGLSFGQKRKTLANSLARYPGLDKQKATEIIQAANLDPMARPQNLDFAEWGRLTERLPDSPAPA